MKNKKYFFGWTNIKWFITEIGKQYGNSDSFFSKKRIESGIAFGVGQIGMIFFLAKKYETFGMSDVIMWASLEFAIAGYIVSQIQKEKKEESNNDSNENPL
jgi:hypothetical protein